MSAKEVKEVKKVQKSKKAKVAKKPIEVKEPKKTKKEKIEKKENVFKVIGSYKKGRRIQKFTKEILTQNRQKAEEYVYSIMGSKHHVKRKEIKIESIEQIQPDQVTDTIIKQLLGVS